MDFANLSSLELRELVVSIGVELKFREQADLLKARAAIAEIARSMGLSLHDLMGGANKSKNSRDGVPAQIKFRNPGDATQQWTGRGRQPNWIKEWIASGKTLSDLEITP